MRLRFNALFILLFFIRAAQASILVNAPEPYPQAVMGDTSLAIYYAGNHAGSPTVANSINTTKGYRFIDTDSTASTDLIFIDVSTNSTFSAGVGQRIAVSVKASGGNEVVLTGASIASGTSAPVDCSTSGGCFTDYKGAFYTAGTTLRISFSLSALCAASGTGSLCTSATVQDPAATTLNQNLEVYFGVVNTTPAPTGSAVASASGAVHETVTFGITDINPTTTCPSGSITNYYFPGDSQIYLYSSSFGSGLNGGVSVQYLIAMALKGSPTATDFQSGGLTSNTIVNYASPTSNVEITGFENTTNGSDNQYSMVVQSQNRAGLVSASSSKCDFSPVQSQNVSGILNESKCFIATAAFQDGRAAPVMMLRQFRDRVLKKFPLGRAFIQKYYEVSPALAEWAWNKPLIRSIALRMLAPVELMAWVTLKIAAAEPDSVQPYLDRVKKNLDEKESVTEESPEVYIENEKKKLEEEQPESADAKNPYIDRVKKRLETEEPAEIEAGSYIDQEREKLPPVQERESPITQVQEGRNEPLGFGEMPDIRNAAGFKVGISPGMQVSVQNGANSFTDIYGTGFKTEFLVHFERQLFHSENFGSFGLGTDFGLAYAGGKGKLQFTFGGKNESVTQFSFLQVPVLVNGTYRFNLLRILRPYVSAGVGTMLYTETRQDSKSDKRGYSFVYHGSAGVSLLMDFLDSKTRRDSYLASGFQHTYWFVEYLYLNTFKSSVMFKRGGIYSGFLFEF